jgi:hypothetical protein
MVFGAVLIAKQSSLGKLKVGFCGAGLGGLAGAM